MNATVHLDGEEEDVTKDVLRAPTVLNVNNRACVQTVLPATTSVVLAHAHLDGEEPSVINLALMVTMV